MNSRNPGTKPGPHTTDAYDDLLAIALDEDLGPGDVTCEAVVPENHRGEAILVSKQPGVVAGLKVALRVFELLESSVHLDAYVSDGDRCREGQRLAYISGAARTILEGERTCLNVLQHASGIATKTRAYVDSVEGTSAKVYDTRKTLPGLRKLEKEAVLAGGGANHRMGLFDMAMLKENHFAASSPVPGGAYEDANRSIRETVRRVVAALDPDFPVEVEVRDLDEAVEAIEAGATLIMLDNFTPEQTRNAVQHIRQMNTPRPVEIESSGGINIETIRSYAECGVDRIAVGAITHSASGLDISLYFRRIGEPRSGS